VVVLRWLFDQLMC